MFTFMSLSAVQNMFCFMYFNSHQRFLLENFEQTEKKEDTNKKQTKTVGTS